MKRVRIFASTDNDFVYDDRKGYTDDLIKYNGHDSKIIIPEGTSSIESDVFRDCTFIEEVVLPDTLYYIGYRAFKGCTNLRKINIPDNVRNIKDEAFSECASLTRIDLSGIRGKNIEYGIFKDCINLKEVILPKITYIIRNYAFHNCVSLQKMYFPDSLSCIYSFAFNKCTNLKQVSIPDTCEVRENAFINCPHIDPENVDSTLDDSDFEFKDVNMYSFGGAILNKYHGKNSSIIIPKSVTVIGEDAFKNNKYIQEVVFPEGLKIIEEDAFDNCTNLKKINLPNSLTDIRESAFWGCGFEKVILPDSLESIGMNAFGGCKNLKEINIPRRCKVDPYAFSRSDNLKLDEKFAKFKEWVTRGEGNVALDEFGQAVKSYIKKNYPKSRVYNRVDNGSETDIWRVRFDGDVYIEEFNLTSEYQDVYELGVDKAAKLYADIIMGDD